MKKKADRIIISFDILKEMLQEKPCFKDVLPKEFEILTVNDNDVFGQSVFEMFIKLNDIYNEKN